MRKFNTLAAKRSNFKPNERRRQTWRKHHLALVDQRSKWFYQQQGWSDNTADPAPQSSAETPIEVDQGSTTEQETASLTSSSTKQN